MSSKCGDFPWQVAIYYSFTKSYLCGGSIINEQTVVTAAHCVSNERGESLPEEDYIIGAGKYYRKYGDERDRQGEQFSEVNIKLFSSSQKKFSK